MAFAAIRWSVAGESLRPVTASLVETETPLELTQTRELDLVTSDQSAATESILPTVTTSESATLKEPVALAAAPLLTSNLPTDWMTTEVGDLAGANEGGEPGEGDGGGSGDGSFFGINISGKRVCYILDGSASMVEAFRRPERTRLGRVKRELIASIRSLSEDQKWFVVFFNSIAHPLPADKFISTDPDERDVYLAWIDRFQPGGGTNPIPAIRGTLSTLQPDVVFLLTDGEFSPQVIPIVDELNTSGVTIHTVGLGDATEVRDRPSLATRVLIELANRNKGSAKFIPDLPF